MTVVPLSPNFSVSQSANAASNANTTMMLLRSSERDSKEYNLSSNEAFCLLGIVILFVLVISLIFTWDI